MSNHALHEYIAMLCKKSNESKDSPCDRSIVWSGYILDFPACVTIAQYGDAIKAIAPSLHDYHCGYIGLPYSLDDTAINQLEVHGGVTFEAMLDNGTFVLGFDTAHLGDNDI